MVPALGWFERGIGKQLLLNRHGLKQWAKSVFVLAARRQGCEKLSLAGAPLPDGDGPGDAATVPAGKGPAADAQ